MPGSMQTQLQPPPLRASTLPEGMQRYMLTLASQLPLRTIDTSGGAYAENLPPAGLNSSTGQSNQNQEIIYLKTSADANVFTVNGGAGGAQTLKSRLDALRFKSDGSSWYLVSAFSAGASGAVTSVFGRAGAVVAVPGDYSVAQITGAAPLASPALTGIPLAPTPPPLDNSTRIATTAFVTAAVPAVITPEAMMGPGIFDYYAFPAGAFSGCSDGALGVGCYRFLLKLPINFSKVSFAAFSNLGGGQNFTFGFADKNGNMLYRSNAFAIPNTAGQTFANQAIPALNLAPGIYYLCVTATGGAVGLFCFGIASISYDSGTGARNIINAAIPMVGKAANPAAGPLAVLPNTLGAITPITVSSSQQNCPFLFFTA